MCTKMKPKSLTNPNETDNSFEVKRDSDDVYRENSALSSSVDAYIVCIREFCGNSSLAIINWHAHFSFEGKRSFVLAVYWLVLVAYLSATARQTLSLAGARQHGQITGIIRKMRSQGVKIPVLMSHNKQPDDNGCSFTRDTQLHFIDQSTLKVFFSH